MKEHRKIDYYKWDIVKGFYDYKASTVQRKNLKDAALHLPELAATGHLIMKPACLSQGEGKVATVPNLWRVGYSDSDEWFDAYNLTHDKKGGLL